MRGWQRRIVLAALAAYPVGGLASIFTSKLPHPWSLLVGIAAMVVAFASALRWPSDAQAMQECTGGSGALCNPASSKAPSFTSADANAAESVSVERQR